MSTTEQHAYPERIGGYAYGTAEAVMLHVTLWIWPYAKDGDW